MRKSPKIRVYDLVKKLGVPKEEVLRVLRELSIGVKSTLSSVDESVAETVELRLKHKSKSASKKKGAGKTPTSTRLRPRLVRKEDATGRARELIQDALQAQEEKPEVSPKIETVEAKPEPIPVVPEPEAAKPSNPMTRTPSIPPPPPSTKRLNASTRLRSSRPTATIPHRPPFKFHPVASHPVQKPSSQRRKPARTVAPPPPLELPVGEDAEITLSEGVTVKELAEKTKRGSRDLIQILMRKGIMTTINQPLGEELAVKICEELGYKATVITFEQEALEQAEKEEPETNVVPRDPVVTVMGHVDHGKTSLLDAIRKTDVVKGEHGGITQHIGAYHVTHKNRGITFLDTPGHEAFTRMRARGAQITDIVILVVAADDGVMPQTIEAIDHAKAAGVPIVVAINKIDKPEANLEKVKKALADSGVMVEEWGGENVCMAVSAKKRQGITELLDMILLVADMKELKANPDRRGMGVVVEAKLDRTKGSIASVLVQNGIIRVGDPFIAGAAHGKIRAMFDDHHRSIRSAGPSLPVEILGLQGVPQAGDSFQVLSSEAKARQISTLRQIRLREKGLRKTSRLTLESLHEQIQEGGIKDLPLILKGDVQGSVEALSDSLVQMGAGKVRVKIIHSATGPITETDILLSSASNAIIIGFNVRPEPKAAMLAASEGVDIRLHNVIYEVMDQIHKAMEGLLDPIVKEVYLGKAEVREVFRIRKIGTIAGCFILDGTVQRNSQVRVTRQDELMFQGRTESLRRFKEDVSEVKAGFDCGISIEGFKDFQVGDMIEAFRTETIASVLETA